MNHAQDSMIMTEIAMWHHNPENKKEVMTDWLHFLLRYKEYIFHLRKEKKSLLMNQGMADEKLLPHFHVYVKDRDGSIRC